jgi:uncharacterized protein (TIGR02145 family)
VDAANEIAYQNYIDNNPNSFSSPATVAEVQAMLTAVNSTATSVLAEVLEDSASPGGANNANGTSVSLLQLQSLPLTGINPDYLAAYQDAIQSETGFSNPPTAAEVQSLVDAVNTVVDGVLVQIGNEADSPDVNNSVVTAAQLSSLSLTGLDAANEIAYQNYIDNNPNSFSSPATVAEVQAMLMAVNSTATSVLAEVLEDSASPGGANNANGTPVSLVQLQSLPLTGINPDYLAAYQDAIQSEMGFSNPPTAAEVQSLVDAVNTVVDGVLVQIGNEGDDPDNVNSVVTAAQLSSLSLTGVDAANEIAYQNYIDNNPNSFSSPATVAEVQAMLTAVNSTATSVLAEVLEDSASPGGANNANGTPVSLAELQSLPLTGINPDYLAAYQDAIQSETGFSNPPTAAEVQSLVDAVNTVVDGVLVQIGNEGDDPDNVNSVITAAQLSSLLLTGVDATNEIAYQNYIDNNPNSFSSPATVAEVQAMLMAVNSTVTSVLAQIGNEGDDPDNVNSLVTAAQLASLPVTGVDAANEIAYQDYIDNNPNNFSSPATVAEVQAMLTAVNGVVAGVMTEVLEDSNSPGGANNANSVAVSLAQLQSLPLTAINPAYISNYQAAINAETNFSNLPTIAEVQVIIDAVNAAAGTISALDCAGATTTGTLTAGAAAIGVSSLVPYTGGNGGFHNGQTVGSTGITGLTATLTAGTFASGSGNLSYAITGTPSGAGTASFALSIGGQGCTLNLTVATNPGSLPAGSGSFAGLSCFDIALSNDNTNNCAPLSGRLAQRADFTNAATHTQVYTFKPIGTVSNVRFAYINTNGSVVTGLSGGNSGNNITAAVTATVNYNTNLNTLALGLTNSNPLRAEIYVIYNDGASNNGTDRQLKLTAQVKDCACCGAFVASGVWRQFMCHNLGANESADPFTPSWELNGHYYQWGRNPTCFGRDGTDGVNPCSSPVYGAAAPWGNTTDNDNAGIITGWSTTAASNGAWVDGSKTANDPCPAGWRVPTATQLTGLANNTLNPRTSVGSWTNSSTNYGTGFRFGQSLFLPAAGRRNGSGGSLDFRGSDGNYWSSAESSSDAQRLYFFSSVAIMDTINRTFGFSLRCVAE